MRAQALELLTQVDAHFGATGNEVLFFHNFDVRERSGGGNGVTAAALTVTAGLHTHPMATLKLEVDGEAHEGMAVGDGAVDATFNAIRAAFPHEVGLRLFAVQSVTGGTDAQARVTVRLEEGGKLVDGQGSDTDTIVASARAYIHALNKLLVKRERTAPAAMTA